MSTMWLRWSSRTLAAVSHGWGGWGRVEALTFSVCFLRADSLFLKDTRWPLSVYVDDAPVYMQMRGGNSRQRSL